MRHGPEMRHKRSGSSFSAQAAYGTTEPNNRQDTNGTVTMGDTIIYKISPRGSWEDSMEAGVFTGAPVDVADGFIHFSTAEQTAETLAKHFAGQDDLVLAAIDAAALGEALVWEPSRGGALFPHLYAPLPATAVLWTRPITMGDDGSHTLPEMGA